ncbi:MAG: CDP-diacylglycerol O-phosphatidyltransferase, partial [Alphaproteobacteria bacterium]|nr:CDP-diacylglycerol O-phosphatidyltransferase [Alphaproteobacteria bacterium]
MGVPAPAGAFVALSPLMLSFALEESFRAHSFAFALILFISGLLLISRLPTFLIKNVPIPHHYVRYLLILVAFFVAALFSAPWYTLSLGAFLYICSIPISFMNYQRKKREK